jgi:hypothetical protein
MSPTGIRRTALISVIVLWFTCFWLAKVSSPSPEIINKPQLLYKVRAYLKSQEDAEKVKAIGQNFTLNGTISRDIRTIKKFMGYVVIQDFADLRGSERIGYICEYLESKSYPAQVLEERPDGTVIVQIGDIYPDEEKAREVAEEVFTQTSNRFYVERYFKDTPYKAFVVVFQDISCKKTAEELKQNIEIITADTELVSY